MKDDQGQNIVGLLQLPTAQQDIERWRVADHERENPLLYGSHLLLALAVEHALGRQDALPILQLAIESIGHLYKFGNIAGFIGYPIRWDAVTSDNWVTRNVGGRAQPWYCCEFLVDENYQHLYCTPFNHPGYVPFDPTDTTTDQWTARKLHRAWEPSMDELVGIVLTYDIVFSLVDDLFIRTEIRRQVTNLSSYLVTHGYLLVRPCGGFTARGASGALPALEYPFNRVFARITGQPVPTSASFEQSLVDADVWECIKPSMQRWGIAGVAIVPVLLGVLGAVLGMFGLYVLSAIVAVLGVLPGVVVGYFLGRAFGVYQARNCFDVQDEDAQTEFVAAYLLKLLPARERFLMWMKGVLGYGWGRHARNFPQFIGLTALQDLSDSTVKDAYLGSLAEAKGDERGRFRNTGFAAAVAVALGDSNEEPNLRKFLDDAYESLTGPDRLRQPMLEKQGEVLVERIRNGTPRGPSEDPLGSLEYIACLALSWLRAKRLEDGGSGVDSDRIIAFPKTPTAWPPPSMPVHVINAGVVPAVGETVSTDLEPRPLFPAFGGVPNREDARPPDVSPEPPPVVRIDRQTILVPESSALVDPGIVIGLRDRVTIIASGSIWAGVWLTGQNGPNGWAGVSKDSKFPLPGTNPYCLLYKIVPPGVAASNIRWRKLGTRLAFTALVDGQTGRIVFRTNDDSPGNGSGAFSCAITIQRAGP